MLQWLRTKLFGHTKKRIFAPCEDIDRIKGWLLHCHKSRDRHDATARWLDRRHRFMASLTAVFSVLAGITVVADFDTTVGEILPVAHLKFWAGFLVGGFALSASFLALLQKEARYGERAEVHRRKAEAYKALIWDIEAKLPRLQRGANETDEWSKEWFKSFEAIEKEQAVIVPQWIVNRIDAKQYSAAIFVGHAEELLSDSPEPKDGGPAVSS